MRQLFGKELNSIELCLQKKAKKMLNCFLKTSNSTKTIQRVMKKIYISFAFVLFNIVCNAQWQQVNNGFSNFTGGARMLGATNTDLFALSIQVESTKQMIMATIGQW
jgi:hypothetical protein